MKSSPQYDKRLDKPNEIMIIIKMDEKKIHIGIILILMFKKIFVFTKRV